MGLNWGLLQKYEIDSCQGRRYLAVGAAKRGAKVEGRGSCRGRKGGDTRGHRKHKQRLNIDIY